MISVCNKSQSQQNLQQIIHSILIYLKLPESEIHRGIEGAKHFFDQTKSAGAISLSCRLKCSFVFFTEDLTPAFFEKIVHEESCRGSLVLRVYSDQPIVLPGGFETESFLISNRKFFSSIFPVREFKKFQEEVEKVICARHKFTQNFLSHYKKAQYSDWKSQVKEFYQLEERYWFNEDR